MTARGKWTRAALVVLAGLIVAGVVIALQKTVLGPTRISAYFTSATAIYPGDEVRVKYLRESQTFEAKVLLTERR